MDWQNDVTARDLQARRTRGFQSIEHVKRYTTTGTVTDQGKTSNLNALAIVAQDSMCRSAGRTHDLSHALHAGHTTELLPGISRGDLVDPKRTTPTHEWAAARGARVRECGPERARYPPRAGVTPHAAGLARSAAPCAAPAAYSMPRPGKIEVVGVDAVELHEPAIHQQLVGTRRRAARATASGAGNNGFIGTTTRSGANRRRPLFT